MRSTVKNSLGRLFGVAFAIMCLTACTSPKPQEQTSSPEVVQTQAVSPEVEDTQTPEATQAPEETDGESTLSVGSEDTDIPNEDVEFGD